MIKWIYILILTPISVFGQIDNCYQYQSVIEYFNSDTSFHSYYDEVKLRFEVSDNIGKGGITPFMTYHYIAGKLGFDNEDLVYSQDSLIIYPMVRELEKEDYSDLTTYNLPCLKNLGVKRNPKIYVGFSRKDENVLIAFTSRIYKRPRHTYGMIHLFFFKDEHEIDKVFETRFIE